MYIDKEKLIRMFEKEMTVKEIMQETGYKSSIVYKHRDQWKEGRYLSREDKQTTESVKPDIWNTDKFDLAEELLQIKNLNKVLMIAIAKLDGVADAFFKSKKVSFNESNAEIMHVVIFHALKDIYEKYGYIPKSADKVIVDVVYPNKNKYLRMFGPKSDYEWEDLEDEIYQIFNNIDYSNSELEEKANTYNRLNVRFDILNKFIEERDFHNKPDINWFRNRVTDMCVTLTNKCNLAEYNFNEEEVYDSFPIFNKELQSLTNGFYNGVNNFMGATGTGKTAFAIQECCYLAKKGIKSIYFALADLSEKQLAVRVLSCLSGEQKQSIEFNNDRAKRIQREYSEVLKNIQPIVKTNNPTIEELLMDVEEEFAKYDGNEDKPRFIVIDYDDMISSSNPGSKNDNDFSRIGHIYKVAESWCREHKVSILMLQQPNKAADDELRAGSRKAKLGDSNGSGDKGRNAVLALGMSRVSVNEEVGVGMVKISITKARNNPNEGRSVDITYEGNYCKFYDTADEWMQAKKYREKKGDYAQLPFDEELF